MTPPSEGTARPGFPEPLRLAILCQEEPVFLGPFLREVIARRPESVAAVFVAGRRGGGERKKTWRDRWESLRSYWLLFEPLGFFAILAVRARARLLGRLDPRSVAGCARNHGIPVHRVKDPNGVDFHQFLRQVNPDLVLNQSELLLRGEVLSIPRLGFINRHASLLPRFRGRLASFWSHAADPPEYGITFHQVSEELDEGPIVLQVRVKEMDPTWSYPRVMKRLMNEAAASFWSAVDARGADDYTPTFLPVTEKAHRFPRIEEVRQYRSVLSRRRKEKK